MSCSVVSLALACALGACGGGGAGAVAARVGDAEITRAALARQVAAIAPEHVVPDPPGFKRCVARLEAQTPDSIAGALKEECRKQYQSLRHQVLESLISSQWLLGEATQRRLGVPDGTTANRAHAIERTIREMLTRGEPPVTKKEVAVYYDRNIARFERRERRYIDIVERLPTKAAASVALKDVVRGADMSKVAIREVFDKMKEAETVPWKRAILKAIFAAKPHALVGPLPLNEKWCFFEVTRVIPRVVKPLAQVQDVIAQQLAGEQRRRTLARFIGAWRKKWIARTDCSPGYVVQKCSQYRGPKAPEDPLAFN